MVEEDTKINVFVWRSTFCSISYSVPLKDKETNAQTSFFAAFPFSTCPHSLLFLLVSPPPSELSASCLGGERAINDAFRETSIWGYFSKVR